MFRSLSGHQTKVLVAIGFHSGFSDVLQVKVRVTYKYSFCIGWL